ncbi:unnamed protein product [Adineta steineri]|uniref:Mucin-like protein n=1 Tax=Adineta steineri TaxID=433720 RepID=A0A814G0H7_9BILA|nr:unnamed protein product [Adineta steineri]CAF3775423.1 unnamed protein product [Adineta steineri]
MTSFNVFIILLLTFIFCRSIKSDHESTTPQLDLSDDSIEENSTKLTTPFSNGTTTTSITTIITSSTASATTKSNETILITTTPTTIFSSTLFINISTTSGVNTLSRKGWWLLVALLITVVVVISIGYIYYNRQQTPYRRFLRNWRSRDDDADNIILQLEQPEIMNGQWPPRISFA